jgi:hypothetical protein
MRLQRLNNITLIFLLGIATSAQSQQPTSKPIWDAEIFDGHLVCELTDSTLLVWDLPSGEPNRALAAALSKQPIARLASDGQSLWAVDDHNLYLWKSAARRWERSNATPRDKLEAFVLVDGAPALVYAKHVVLPTLKKSFDVPSSREKRAFLFFNVLTALGEKDVLWLGTGQGEWGGHLLTLDIRSGRWNIYYDPLHYATGIARASDSHYVSWSMSHFLANTVIRTHGANTDTITSFPELKGKYYQRIVYSEFDRQLYGIEQTSLVSIDNGQPTVLADLGQLAYEPTNYAIGIAPSIVALFSIGPRSLIVVHDQSLPFLYSDGTVRQLSW